MCCIASAKDLAAWCHSGCCYFDSVLRLHDRHGNRPGLELGYERNGLNEVSASSSSSSYSLRRVLQIYYIRERTSINSGV